MNKIKLTRPVYALAICLCILITSCLGTTPAQEAALVAKEIPITIKGTELMPNKSVNALLFYAKDFSFRVWENGGIVDSNGRLLISGAATIEPADITSYTIYIFEDILGDAQCDSSDPVWQMGMTKQNLGNGGLSVILTGNKPAPASDNGKICLFFNE